ncbi:hypothetical protein SUGI_0524900 [Cryptomeria japonica]|uniref:uncharacterized protein LOC131036808 n=1 Tax=Cryptomeria japonica TaxID=3369 RepID=UPI0024089FA4|nr:uncharacterized protein LOC131036808 [Cryptomeria japonica]GLJ26857.1 hypothetical protein SUGI_0524900 [Cryptomeria japonica]
MAGTRFVTHVKAILLLILVFEISSISSQSRHEEGRCGCSCSSSTRAFPTKVFTPLLMSATVGLYVLVAVFWFASVCLALRYGLKSCIDYLNFNDDSFEDYNEIIARPRIRAQNCNTKFLAEKDQAFAME